MTATARQLHIRWLISRDMPEVCRIEAESFPHPWSEAEFRRAVRHRNVIGMVAESGDRVVGYMIYRLENDELVVLNFAVAPEWRRLGIGCQMVERLVGKLSGQRRTALTLVVGEWNLAAQLFFRRQGFLAESVLPGHYEDSGEDGYAMAYRIDP